MGENKVRVGSDSGWGTYEFSEKTHEDRVDLKCAFTPGAQFAGALHQMVEMAKRGEIVVIKAEGKQRDSS